MTGGWKPARLVAAVAVGLLLGWGLASRNLVRHRQDLFHARAARRLAALSWLEGAPGPETVRLIHDYLAWEQQPLLRRRAAGLLRRLEARA